MLGSDFAPKGARVIWITTIYKHFAPSGAKTAGAFPHIGRQSRVGFKLILKINNSEAIKRILNECRTIAVVGLSSKVTRPSHGVAGYMQRAGYRIVPVNPNESEVLGERAYASLTEVPEQIDLVDVFRRSEEAGAAVDEAIAIGARAVWLQEGVIDHAAAQRALNAGLLVVMDRCWLKEHLRRQK